MEQLVPLALFVIGLILIVKGGDAFVDAAASIARASGIPTFVIGATIVSFATTLPEIIVSLIAASEGKTDMAIGNAIGSVSANTGLIMALGIICMPIVIKRRMFAFKGLLLLAAIASLWGLSMSGELTVAESGVMLAIFAVFIWENIREARAPEGGGAKRARPGKKQWAVNAVCFAVGAAGIVFGSKLLVENGSILAAMLGVPENVIALTAVAIGTSLPELVTAIAALRKREGCLSAGNVLGANIIDIALILPACSAVNGGSLPVSVQNIVVDLPVCLFVAAVVVLPSVVKERFYRWQGVLAMLIYCVYIIWVIF